MLRKDAHRYFLETVMPDVETYHDAAILLEKKYNFVVGQAQIKIHLSSLRVERFVKNDVNAAAALAIVYKRILTISRQVPESYRSDPHRIEFLRNAVVSHQWAKELLIRKETAGISFQQLYEELEIAVQLERETNAAEVQRKAVVNPTSREMTSANFSG